MNHLYFLRHAIAELRGTVGVSDVDRPLTEEGISKMRRAAKGIEKIVEKFDCILTSPLKRAYDTAQIVAERMNCLDKIEIVDILSPGCVLKELMKELSKYEDKENILIVGHEPDLSTIISAMLGCSRQSVQMKKGALCRVDMEKMSISSAKLIWLLQPKILRMI